MTFKRLNPPPAPSIAVRCIVRSDDFSRRFDLQIDPDGRLYSTLCEFQTQELPFQMERMRSAIIGIVGNETGFHIEARLNRAR